MSTRERAVYIINQLSEEELNAFLTLFGSRVNINADNETVNAVSDMFIAENAEAYKELAK